MTIPSAPFLTFDGASTPPVAGGEYVILSSTSLRLRACRPIFRILTSPTLIHDQNIFAEFFFDGIHFLPAVVQHGVRFGRLTLRNLQQSSIQILFRALAGILDRGDSRRDLAEIAQEDFTPLSFLSHAHPAIQIN